MLIVKKLSAGVTVAILIIFSGITATVFAQAPSSSSTSNSTSGSSAPTGSTSNNNAINAPTPSSSSNNGGPASSGANNATAPNTPPTSSGTNNSTSQSTTPADSSASDTTVPGAAPAASNTGNSTAASSPNSSNSNNTTSAAPGSSNTNNTASGAPGSSNSNNITLAAPGSSNTNNTTPAAPGSSNTDNTTSPGGTTPGGNVNPPSDSTPQSSSGGGSGGAVISYSATPCSDVAYGDWSLQANGYQYRNVIGQNPTGCSLTASQQEARSRKYPVVGGQISGVKYYPDGSLLRGPDWKIYIIVKGKKQLIRDLKELLKYKGQKIYNVSNEVLAQYPDAEVLGIKVYPNGSLLRGPDKKIYLIVNGKKQLIKNLKELLSYQGKKINDVGYDVLAQYPEAKTSSVKVSGVKIYGAKVPSAKVPGTKAYGNCNLLRGPDSKIYLIVNGKKRQIRNIKELFNYQGQKIYNVNDKILNSYPTYQEI